MRSLLALSLTAGLLSACTAAPSNTSESATVPGATTPATAAPAPAPAAPGEASSVISPSEGTSPAAAPLAGGAPASETAPAATHADARPVERPDEFTEVTLPAGTVMTVALETAVGSATSNVEDAVRARVTRGVRIGRREVVPEGATLAGTVTEAVRSGKVKGRARVALRFHALVVPGSDEYRIRTRAIAREARATKKKDATKIGVGAAAGAVVGGLIGGGKGAAVGTAVGGGAGTAVVLNTRGEEVGLPAGTHLTVRLSEPVSVRVRTNQ